MHRLVKALFGCNQYINGVISGALQPDCSRVVTDVSDHLGKQSRPVTSRAAIDYFTACPACRPSGTVPVVALGGRYVRRFDDQVVEGSVAEKPITRAEVGRQLIHALSLPLHYG